MIQVSRDVTSLNHLKIVIAAEEGEKGSNRDCSGKNAQHTIVKVPVGTIVRHTDGHILGDLEEEGMMFIAARGGAGGHGNAFFASDVQQAPKIAEFGAKGEDKQYVLEVRSMAHVGLVITRMPVFPWKFNIASISRSIFIFGHNQVYQNFYDKKNVQHLWRTVFIEQICAESFVSKNQRMLSFFYRICSIEYLL